MNMNHLNYLQEIVEHDVENVKAKEETYQGSWKKRGGVGAFMMLARKWDRIENMMETMDFEDSPEGYPDTGKPYKTYHCLFDLAKQQKFSGEDGSLLAEIRDLRRYLLLVEAEMMAQQTEVN
jgi:hypothetical protein